MREKIKLHFVCDEKFVFGLEELSNDLYFEPVNKCCADVVVEAKKDGEGLTVEYKENSAIITYSTDICFYRAVALLCQSIYEGKTSASIKEKPFFKTNGVMVDLARKNPLNVDGVKYFIRQHSLMGLNTVFLYLEDMFEVPERPYFGYMRGRYTQEEIKELDAYAQKLGVELVPVIELLGHMSHLFKFQNSAPFRGNSDTLLMGADATYDLIDDMVKAIKESFTTDKLYIGCDETFNATEGAYEAIHGKVSLEEAFLDHMSRVEKIVLKYGLKPYMFSDMFFYFRYEKTPPADCYWCDDHVKFDKELLDKIPENIGQVLWNYTEEDEDKMVRIMEKNIELGRENVWFGGARMWQSLCFQYTPTIKCAKIGIRACKRTGIDQMGYTLWSNSGECPHFFALPSLILCAEMDYNEDCTEDDLQRKVKFLYDMDYVDFTEMERVDHIHENDLPELASTFLLYNDPLYGLLDLKIQGLDLKKYYGKLAADYKERGCKFGPLMLSFNQFKAVLDILELKGDYSVRLKNAYDTKNVAELYALRDEAILIKSKFEALIEADKELFFNYYKTFGFESLQMSRYTMCARFDMVVCKLDKFLSGEIKNIEELEQEKLPYDFNTFGNPSEENIFFGNGFSSILSVN